MNEMGFGATFFLNDMFSGVADKIMGKFGELEGVAGGVSSKVNKAMNGIMAGASITALGVGMMTPFNEAIAVAEEFNKTMSGLGAVADLDKTSNEFLALEDTAKRLGASTQFTSTQVASGMKEMSMAGMSTKNVLSGIEGMLNLAATEGMELARASEIAGNSMNLFNIKADQMYKVLDKKGQEHAISGTQMIADSFAKASTSYSLGVGEMGESIKYFAGAISTFGIPLNETTAMIGLLANKGFKGSVATASLSTALGNLTDKGKKATAAEFGLKFFDQQGKFVGMVGVLEELQRVTGKMTQSGKSELINRMFGADATKLIVSLMDASQEATDQFGNVKTLKGADALKYGAQKQMEIFGVSGEMASRMLDNLAGDKERMSSAWEGLMLTIGSALEPTIRKVIQFGTSFVDVINSIADSKFGAILSHIAYFGGALVATLGGLTTAFYTFRLAQVALIPVMQTFGITSFVALLPLIKIVAVVGLVVGAIYLLSKAFNIAKDSHENYDSGISETSFLFKSGLIEPITRLGSVIYKTLLPITTFFDKIKKGVSELISFDSFIGTIGGFDSQIKTLSGSLSEIGKQQEIWTAKMKYWAEVNEKMASSPIFAFFMKFTGVLRGVWEVIQNLNTTGFSLPQDVADSLKNIGILDIVLNIGTWLVRALNFVYGFIDGFAEGFEEVKSIFTTVWELTIMPLWESLKSMFSENDFFKDLIGSGKGAASTWQSFGKIVGKILAYIIAAPIANIITHIVRAGLLLANAFMWVSNNIGWVNILKVGLIALGVTLAPFLITTGIALASLTVAFTLLAAAAVIALGIILFPFIVIGAAIYGVYKGLLYLYDNWENLGGLLLASFTMVGNWFESVWNNAIAWVSSVFEGFKGYIATWGNYLNTVFWSIVGAGINAFSSLGFFISGIVDAGINAFSNFGTMIVNTLQPVWNFAMQIWNLFTAMPQTIFNLGVSVMTALGSAITGNWELLKNVIINLVRAMPFGEQLLGAMGVEGGSGISTAVASAMNAFNGLAPQTNGQVIPNQATEGSLDSVLGLQKAQAEAFSPRVDNQINVQPSQMPDITVVLDNQKVGKIVKKEIDFIGNTK